jgi:hypothetical protein
MRLYKLTDQMDLRKIIQNGLRDLRETSQKNNSVCTEDVIHAYKNINLDYSSIRSMRNSKILNMGAEGKVVAKDYGKVGCFELTTIKQIPLPEWYIKENKRKDVSYSLPFFVLKLCWKFMKANIQMITTKKSNRGIERIFKNKNLRFRLFRYPPLMPPMPPPLPPELPLMPPMPPPLPPDCR